MTVSRLSGNRVLIFLEETDMREYALDFSRMDKSDSHSMRVLSDLSREACRGEGIPTGGMRLHVEALGMIDGCYLLVTVSARKKTYRRRQGTLCYRFESVSDFLDCLSLLDRSGIACAKSRAYSFGGAYWLVFAYPSLPLRARMILSEFGAARHSSLTAARLAEHGSLLCGRNAIEVIGRSY